MLYHRIDTFNAFLEELQIFIDALSHYLVITLSFCEQVFSFGLNDHIIEHREGHQDSASSHRLLHVLFNDMEEGKRSGKCEYILHEGIVDGLTDARFSSCSDIGQTAEDFFEI